MKVLAIVLTTLVFAGCSTLPVDTKVMLQAKVNFQYVSDKSDEWRAYTDISKRFAGDCEDFAFTLQRQIGGKVRFVRLLDGTGHAVLVKDGLVYDNLQRWPVSLSSYPGKFGRTLVFSSRGERAELIDNSGEL